MLVWGVVAWIAGIVLADRGDLKVVPTLPIAVAVLVLAFVVRTRNQRRALLLAASLLLGASRWAIAQPATTATTVWAYNDRRVTVQGTVIEQPDRREDQQTAVVAARTLELGHQRRQVEGLIQVQLPPVPELRYGQQVRLVGDLATPPTAADFDYRLYLARHGIRSVMDQPRLTVLPGIGGSWLLRPLLRLNDAARLTTLRLLPEPHASLLIGILLGIQATIPAPVLNDFSRTGTSHILVISGWNVTLIVSSIIGMLSEIGVGRRVAAWLALTILAAYVLFVGPTPSVLRAAAMGGLVVLADLSGRPTERWTLLAAATGLLTLLDPHVIWDVGFQLSALATAGLFAFGRPIESFISRGPFKSRLLAWSIEPLTATLAASTLSLPILLYTFGNLSLIAPLANIVILPFVPLAMAFGTLAVIGGLLWLPLGQLLALLSWPFLHWLIFAAHLLARVPRAATLLPPFHVSWVWAYYAMTSAWIIWSTKQEKPRQPPTSA